MPSSPAAWLDALAQDARHAFRTLRRSPGLVVGSSALMPIRNVRSAWVAFVTSAMLVAMVGLSAGVIPAYRTSKVDPVNALRQP